MPSPDSLKILKCLCNDESFCPLSKVGPNETRQCISESVCYTQRLRSLNGTEYLKYYCDGFAQNFRKTILQYRDCKMDTSNEDDLALVRDSSEHCCDSQDFCNQFLNPTRSLPDYHGSYEQVAPANKHLSTATVTTAQQNLLEPTNILVSSLFLVFLLFIFILISFFVCRWRRTRQHTLKCKSNHLSSLSTPSESNASSRSSTNHSDNTTSTRDHKKKIYALNSQLQERHQLNAVKMNEYLNPLSGHGDSKHMIIKSLDLFEPLMQSPCNGLVEPVSTMRGQDLCMSSNDYCVSNTTATTTSGCLDSLTTNNSAVGTGRLVDDQAKMLLLSSLGTGSVNNSNGFEWSGSGSGAGVPQLLQRTIARQIKLVYPCIGKGRFGEVYKGMWRDELVAVKTFNSADEKSWENECSIYNTSGFRHENILGFIAADNIDRGNYTELWIITEFHENGSLYDYLNVSGPLSAAESLKMALSIVNGLDHLHTAIESCTGKPALAHCDLKSKNVLVKADLTCCISDLGLALCGDKLGNVMQSAATIRTGTKRYMAPEILNKTINYKSLLQFQNAEMYSLALIFWELLRKTKFHLDQPVSPNEIANQSSLDLSTASSDTGKTGKRYAYSYEYKMPYYEYVQADPEELQMKQLVCDQKKRPEINALWRKVPILNELSHLTEELWVENANGRLNALRLKKSLNLIKRKYIQI